MQNSQLLLYLVTDSGMCRGRSLCEMVSEAVAGGVTMVQLREKSASTRQFVELARALHSLLADRNVPLIVNDRIDVALASGAEGVHIGQSDMPCDIARRLMGRDAIVGLSVESLDDVVAANALDVDYIGVSPVFSTPTKMDTASPFGLEGLSRAAKLSCHPCVAIGGVNAANAAEVIKAGADGLAVVSAIMAAEDPRRAAMDLIELIR